MARRTIAEILELARTNPSALTIEEAAFIHRSAKKPISGQAAYARHKLAAAARQANISAAGREIGDIPSVADPERKAACAKSIRAFGEAYFKPIFYLPFAPDHLQVIATMERSIANGGQFAIAMPRGSGKTALIETACLWAALYGYCRYVVVIAANTTCVVAIMDSLRTSLETNDLLAEDFPEVCFPIHALKFTHNLAAGQRYHGQPTRISLAAKKIILPTMPDSRASGVIITCSGMTAGSIRGQKHKLVNGEIVRPDLAFIDDPQTPESAHSPLQCARREAILAGDVMGMAGPARKMTALMATTVICPDDMADRLLNRQIHPDWQGTRTKFIYAFPTNEKLWERYADIRADALRADGDIQKATDFYRENRAEMDAGAVVAWPEKFDPNEISAVQKAMDLRIKNEEAFWAEYQNEPKPALIAGQEPSLTPAEIRAKINGRARAGVPLPCQHLTAFIDIQAKILYWLVAAWEDDFTGYVIDYGSYPKQTRAHYTANDARPTLATLAPKTGREGSIYAGLQALADALLGRAWPRDDGAAMRITRCLIDANWGESTDVVYQFCRQSAHAALLLPAHGKFVGASSTPFSEFHKRAGETIGYHWRLPKIGTGRPVRHVIVDTNYWKTFCAARLAVAMGDRGCLSLFGANGEEHRMLAEHLTAEYRVRTSAAGRTVDEWKTHPNRPENHWLDCLVGAAAAASMLGAQLPGTVTAKKSLRNRKHYTQEQLRRA
ncbi:MAG: phage terminase large subunit family protein [Acidobacteria bacterium]|nr:phage terminase large subunit family protein [Acidobacteriota bacterium]